MVTYETVFNRNGTDRVLSLEYLRGIAALLVLYAHFLPTTVSYLVIAWVLHFTIEVPRNRFEKVLSEFFCSSEE